MDILKEFKFKVRDLKLSEWLVSNTHLKKTSVHFCNFDIVKPFSSGNVLQKHRADRNVIRLTYKLKVDV